MFCRRLWGLERRGGERVSGGVVGMVVGGVVAVGWTVGGVLLWGREGGRDAAGWAWIDVVSAGGAWRRGEMIRGCGKGGFTDARGCGF